MKREEACRGRRGNGGSLPSGVVGRCIVSDGKLGGYSHALSVDGGHIQSKIAEMIVYCK
jgi:hypothetical protein